MMLSHFLCIICVLLVQASQSKIITLTSDAGSNPVNVGQSVTLSCTIPVKFIRQRNSSVIIQHGQDMKAENCRIYKPEKYSIICDPVSNYSTNGRKSFIFHIKSVEWTERGTWDCVLSGNQDSITLNVVAPSKMLPIQVTQVHVAQKGASRETAVDYDSIRVASSSSSQPLAQAYGLGTRSNPYDLSTGVTIALTCRTECGYPPANLEWNVNNMTQMQPRRLEAQLQVNRDPCDRSETTSMSTSTAVIYVACQSYDLVGLNKIRCSVTDSGDHDAIANNKNVYVLCSGGTIPMSITWGETIGLGVASVILVALFITGCFMMRRRFKESTHSRGQLI